MAIATWTDGNQLGASDVNTKIIQVTMVDKPIDESVTSSVALQNDNHLKLQVHENTNYFVKAHIIVSGVIYTSLGTSKGGIQYGFYGPSGATFSWCSDTLGAGSAMDDDGIGNVSRARQQISSLPGLQTYGNTSANYIGIGVRGTLKVGATNGTFGFQWAQNVSDGTATFVRALSCLVLSKLV